MTAFVRDGLTELLASVEAHIRSNEEDREKTTDYQERVALDKAMRELGYERFAIKQAMSDLGISQGQREGGNADVGSREATPDGR